MSYLENLRKRLMEQSQQLEVVEYDLEQRDEALANLENDLEEKYHEFCELKQRHSDHVAFIVCGSLVLLGIISYTML